MLNIVKFVLSLCNCKRVNAVTNIEMDAKGVRYNSFKGLAKWYIV